MLAKIQLMWDDRYDLICVARHRNNLIDKKAKPFHSDPYRAGPRVWGISAQDSRKSMG